MKKNGKPPLTAYRELYGLSKAELARLLHTSWANVHRWETGQRQISAEMALRVSRELDIPARLLRPDVFGE